MAKPDYSNEPKPQIHEDVKHAIFTFELSWWIQRLSRKQVREQIKEKTGIDIKPKNLARVLFWYCDVYGKWKRKSETKIKDLDERGWTKPKTVVESLKNCLGRDRINGLDDATIVIRSRIATNRDLVDGLPSRLKFWE